MTLTQALRGGGAASSRAQGDSDGNDSPDFFEEIEPKTSGKLSAVVDNAKQRWFREAWDLAHSGDYRQMALLGQMFSEGYGCEKDPAAAQQWTERAKKGRAVRAGVYCTL
eukprot:CAMPEP_0197847414 /NCGR_PEP_ID=MMETSP1438-20131217/6065_1 /TAXON_ID=1461541 /ORGANISM="Pterosperma sp., Strain CCMP1384" /LENGTH=109 /DNA_ID=CAMNT_0043459327 /DNA_START=280 /DNA_END=609 /DNA_ORIENTATION=+